MNEDEVINLCKELLVKPFEGYAKKLPDGSCIAYPDPATRGAPWTIGYGSTGSLIKQGCIWTHRQAEEALEAHLRAFLRLLINHSPSVIDEPPKRVSALLSFIYNVGPGNYRISTLRKKVNQKDWFEASREILKWNKANGKVMRGLTRRREAESMLLK